MEARDHCVRTLKDQVSVEYEDEKREVSLAGSIDAISGDRFSHTGNKQQFPGG